MGGLWLASAGDDIKLWDCDLGFSLLHTFNPHCNRNIAALAWNFEGSLLASCALESEQVVLTYTKNTVLTTVELPCGAGVQCTDFSSASRFLLCGGAEGVSVWDLKTKTLKKSFQDHKGPVTTARYNWNSSYIAAGSETGEIILHNIQTGQSSSPLLAPNIQAIRQLEYSTFKKSLLGTASDDGSVCLWDCNSRRLLHTFKGGHLGPATGLAFSPINEMLMMSVGLDKRFVCYDIQKKQVLKVFDAQSPLTCIDVMPDGATAAVGSTRGKVYIYDLRQGGSTPLFTFQAHKTSVQSVKFMPTAKSKTEEPSGGMKAIVLTNSATRRQLPSAPTAMQDVTPSRTGQTPDISCVPQAVSPNPSASVDIFSPAMGQGDQSHGHSKSLSHIDLTTSTAPGDSTFSGVFSPLARETADLSAASHTGTGAHRDSSFFSLQFVQNNSNVENSSLHHPHLNFSGVATTTSKGQSLSGLHPHQSASIQNLSHNMTGGQLSQNVTAEHLSHLQLSGTVQSPVVGHLSHPRMCSSLQSLMEEVGERGEGGQSMRGDRVTVGGGGLPLSQSMVAGMSSLGVSAGHQSGAVMALMEAGDGQNRSAGSASPDSAAISGGEEGQGGSRDSSSSSSSFPAPPTCTTTLHRNYPVTMRTVNKAVSRAEPLEVGASGGAGVVQRELLRGLVADAMEDVRDELHRDIQSLHLAMLRQFHNFEREMRAALTNYSDTNQKLLLYVRQLEEENRRLKKNY